MLPTHFINPNPWSLVLHDPTFKLLVIISSLRNPGREDFSSKVLSFNQRIKLKNVQQYLSNVQSIRLCFDFSIDFAIEVLRKHVVNNKLSPPRIFYILMGKFKQGLLVL